MREVSARRWLPGSTAVWAGAVAWALVVPAAGAQVNDDPLAGVPTREEQEVMAEILALQEEIGTLLRALRPELQDAVLERLEAMAANAMTAEDDAGEAVHAESGIGAIEPAEPPEAIAPSDQGGEAPVEAPPAIPTRGRIKAPPSSCNTLTLFDSNEDGEISARDRYWRHLYLWSDADGDGQMQEAEVQSAYDRGVRSLDVRLDTFLRKDGDQTVPSEVEVDRFIVLDVSGDGFELAGRMLDDGVLVIDAGRLSRGDGPSLVDETGLPLEALQTFRAGLRLLTADGDGEALACP